MGTKQAFLYSPNDSTELFLKCLLIYALLCAENGIRRRVFRYKFRDWCLSLTSINRLARSTELAMHIFSPFAKMKLTILVITLTILIILDLCEADADFDVFYYYAPPTITSAPSRAPTRKPTFSPTSRSPTRSPTVQPSTMVPTTIPTYLSTVLTESPTVDPSQTPGSVCYSVY